MSNPEAGSRGIEPEYWDSLGHLNSFTAETPAALLNAMKFRSGSGPLERDNLLFVSPDSPTRITEPEDRPGAGELRHGLQRLASVGRALNENQIIKTDALYLLMMEALEKLWTRFTGDAAFDDNLLRNGHALECFAAFQVASERFDCPRQRWPDEYRRPAGRGIRTILFESADLVRFFMWIQWHLDTQFAQAARLLMIQDLPIGFDPDRFDAWQWREVLANGVSVGTPADAFNAKGQNWGLPPFSARRLRAAGYEPFSQALRASLERSGGLRIGHVMCLFRLFCIRAGCTPEQGIYIHYSSAELLAILALESQRARAFIIGDDIGMVESDVRESLADQAMLTYHLFWFKPDRLSEFPREALAANSTRDLPTISGMRSEADLEHQRIAGVDPNRDGAKQMRDRLKQVTDIGDGADDWEVTQRTYLALSSAPSRNVFASFDDVFEVEERPNIPAVVNDDWPNWSLALPAKIEDIYQRPLVQAVADSLNGSRSVADSEVSAGDESLQASDEHAPEVRFISSTKVSFRQFISWNHLFELCFDDYFLP